MLSSNLYLYLVGEIFCFRFLSPIFSAATYENKTRETLYILIASYQH